MILEAILIIGFMISGFSVLILGLAKAVAHFTLITYGDKDEPNFLEEVLPWHGVIPLKYMPLFVPYIFNLNAYGHVPEDLRNEASKYLKLYQIALAAATAFFLTIIYFLE